MQGTAATVMAAVFSALRAAGTRLRDQTIVIYGAGTAGLGIADMMRDQMIREGLAPEEATRRFYPMGSRGLLIDDTADLLDFQQPYARTRREVTGWAVGARGIGLAEVVARVHPTMLIGTSTHAGAFTEAIVKDMAAHTERPIIMPLSNPTSKCEALPADLIEWTDGRVLTATGSPFDPVTYEGRTYHIAQANNALVFPGLGSGRHRGQGQPDQRQDDRRRRGRRGRPCPMPPPSVRPLLPPMTDLRAVSAAVGAAVAATAAEEGLAQTELHDLVQQVHDAMWRPEYPHVELQRRGPAQT